MVKVSSNDDSQPRSGDGASGADAPTVVALAGGQTVFGRYELESIAGRGGMGVVWRARDRELERVVALKFLPEMVSADPEALKDLKSETRRSLQLTHPHIVRVHDFVQAGSLAAISMEFISGASLARLKADAPGHCLTLQELAPLTVQLCDALYYAHQSAHIVHRDLKPANLLVSEQRQLKVTDFGISRSLSETHSRLTNSMLGTSGTLLYMSPQQLMGDNPTPADDMYALGATLYELLAGKPPFHRGDGFSLMTQIREKAPPTLNAKRAELEINGELIPPQWEAVILSCLEKNPANRPADAREVAARLGLATPAIAPWSVASASATSGVAATGAASSLGPGTRQPPTGPVTGSESTGTPPPPAALSAPPSPPPMAPATPRGGFPWKPAAGAALLAAVAVGATVRWMSTHHAASSAEPIITAIPTPAPSQPRVESKRAEPSPQPVRSTPTPEPKPTPIVEVQRPVVETPRGPSAEELKAEKERRQRDEEKAEKLQRDERKRGEEAIVFSEKQAQQERNDEVAIARVINENARKLPGGTVSTAEVAAAGNASGASNPNFFRRTWTTVKTINPIRPGTTNPATNDSSKGAEKTTAAEPAPPAAQEPKTPPSPGSNWTTPTAGIRFVWIKPGTFTMGSSVGEAGHESNEGPETQVRIAQGFWLGATPVTHRQWAALMIKDRSDYTDNGPDAPVEQVSWIAAMAYCRQLNTHEAAAGRLPDGYAYTLPTEAEWEYACRAGTKTPQYATPLDPIAWYEINRGERKGPHPVGQKMANAWGLHDMLGNVFQLCRGWDNAYAGGERTDNPGVTTGERRVARGGGWSSRALICRAAFRLRLRSGSEENNVGFRVALAPLPRTTP